MRTQNLLSIIALPILLAATVAGCGSSGGKRVLTSRPSFLLGNAEWINPQDGQQEVSLLPTLRIRISNDTDTCTDARGSEAYIQLKATLPGSPNIGIGEGFVALRDGSDCEVEYPVTTRLTPGLEYVAKLASNSDGQINFTEEGIKFRATSDTSNRGMSVISQGWSATDVSGDIDTDSLSDMGDLILQILGNDALSLILGSFGPSAGNAIIRIDFDNYPNPIYLASDLWIVELTDYDELATRLLNGGSVQASDFQLVSGDNDLDLTGCDAPLGRCIVREDTYVQYLVNNGAAPQGTTGSPSRVLILNPSGGFEPGKTYLVVASDQMENIQGFQMNQTWVKPFRFQ